jgi:ribosomal protein S18 acetylase RimI-like enzyme
VTAVEDARPATIEDLPALEQLAREAIDELRPTRGGELWAQTLGRREPLAETFSVDLTDPGRLVVVGCVDTTIVGYGMVRLQGLPDGRPIGVVGDLYTHPQARGIGVGEAMMDLLVAWCNERHCTGIDAVALPGNRATKNFFETFGLTARAILVHRALP